MIIRASGAIESAASLDMLKVRRLAAGDFADEGRRRLATFASRNAMGPNPGVIVSHRASKDALWLLEMTISVQARALAPGDFS
jgi:hypothetical protein